MCNLKRAKKVRILSIQTCEVVKNVFMERLELGGIWKKIQNVSVGLNS